MRENSQPPARGNATPDEQGAEARGADTLNHDPTGTSPRADVPAHVAAMGLPVFTRCAKRSGMSPDSFVQALTQTSLSNLAMWTQADLETLLLSAERHGLSPIGREVFLLREGDSLDGPAVVVLGVDGWSRVINAHKEFAGMQFRQAHELVDGVPAWMECTLHRWDRRVPTRVREYFNEVRGFSQPWLTHPRRMLRHKALVQCARLAFGLVDVYDHDEAQRILKGKTSEAPRSDSHPAPSRSSRASKPLGVDALKARLQSQAESAPRDTRKQIGQVLI